MSDGLPPLARYAQRVPEDRHTRPSMSVRLPEDLQRRLHQAATDHGLSVNYLANQAIKYFLEHLKRPDELRLTKDDT